MIRDKEHRAEVFGKLQNSIIFKLLETKEIDLLDPYKLGPDIADEVMGWIDGLSGNLLAEFKESIEKQPHRDFHQITLPPPVVSAIYATKPQFDKANFTKEKFHVLILASDEGSGVLRRRREIDEELAKLKKKNRELHRKLKALSPIKVDRDAVSRKKVLKIIGEEVNWHAMATRIEKLPLVCSEPFAKAQDKRKERRRNDQ